MVTVDENKQEEGLSICEQLGLSEVKVLLIDDDEVDYHHIASILRNSEVGPMSIEWEATFRGGGDALLNGAYDICLLDYRLEGQKTGLDLIWAVGDRRQCPIIMLTGAGGHDVDVRAMKAGVADYFEKAQVTAKSLTRSMRYAIHRDRLARGKQGEESHDALTGFDNPALFRAKLEVALSRARRARSRLAILSLDIDGFKALNDKYGHGFGDEVLSKVGERLRNTIRECDVAASGLPPAGRIGGNTFCLALEDISSVDDIAVIGEKIIDAIGARYYTDECTEGVTVDVSVGCAFYPEDTDTSELLLEFSELALMRAKKTLGNALCTYNHFGTVPQSFEGDAEEKPAARRTLREDLLHGDPTVEFPLLKRKQ